MFLHYFRKKENKDKQIADKIYILIIKFSKSIINQSDLYIKKDFNSSFEIISIFLYIFFSIYKKKPKKNMIIINLCLSIM